MIDTRSTHVQAREILDRPARADHGSGDGRRRHARPLRPRLRQPRLPARHRSGVTTAASTFMDRTGEARRARIAHEEPDIAADLRRGRHRPAGPDVLRDARPRCRRTARVELRYLGRGHTDHDIVIGVPGRGRPVRRRPARERRRAVLRRRLSARLAGDGLARRRACPGVWSCRATATTPAAGSPSRRRPRSRRSPTLARRVHARRDDPRRGGRRDAVPRAIRPRTSERPLERALAAAPRRAGLSVGPA